MLGLRRDLYIRYIRQLGHLGTEQAGVLQNYLMSTRGPLDWGTRAALMRCKMFGTALLCADFSAFSFA